MPAACPCSTWTSTGWTTPPTRSRAGSSTSASSRVSPWSSGPSAWVPALPLRRLDVLIDGTGDEPRRIALRSPDADYARYLEAVA